MKKNPKESRIEEDMQPGRLVDDGFLGDDTRGLSDIIREDLAVLNKLGVSPERLGRKMRLITRAAMKGMEDPVEVDGYEAYIYESRGWHGCPFKDNYRVAKRNTYVTDLKTGEKMRWSDLNIHLIQDHGFFQGKGAEFRLEPAELVKFLRLEPETDLEEK